MGAAESDHATDPKVLERAVLGVGYIPDFLPEQVRFWFVPSREQPSSVYLEFVGEAHDNWESYYTSKGWAFVQHHQVAAEGPYHVAPSALRFEILEQGRFFAPKPTFRFGDESGEVPVVGLQKRRPLNPWKPNYIQALNFIKKYEWKGSFPQSVHYAVWEIEECGQVAGSTAWKNAERILLDQMSSALVEAIADIFFHRPEDYPLGSEVYLRVLAESGEEGFAKLLNLAEHPISRKRRTVAQTLGAVADARGTSSLLKLLEDEDPEVRTAALRALGRVGVDSASDPNGLVAEYLESEEVPKRVWAAQALYSGGDESYQKFFITLVKDEPRLLTDMGELGDVLAALKLLQAVPFLITRLKHEKPEFRADAAESFEKLTGVELDYRTLDSQDERRQAIKMCNRWWSDYKKSNRSGGKR
ncbi:MAG: HEAT repeat domain-containing protein [Planctomycetes bacterium]|nr:HEAT repeat domain-containing protein [Planctomycetota bacterium]